MKASSLPLLETPIAIVDLETTGLSPAGDRIVEVSVIRVGTDGEIEAEYDTLVNPRRRVAGTEIHGITDEDVRHAPEFSEVVPDIQKLCAGAFVSAYNVYFDSKFLDEEFRLAGQSSNYPYFCLMYMRPLLGLGKRCNLREACRLHQIEVLDAHTAYGDAIASAALWKHYRNNIGASGFQTFGDLRAVAKYKFFQTFDYDCPGGQYDGSPYGARIISRSRCHHTNLAPPRQSKEVPPASPLKPSIAADQPAPQYQPPHRQDRVAEYFEALATSLSDLYIDDEEFALLKGLQRHLSQEQIRWAHSRLLIGLLSEFGSDGKIDATEDAAISATVEALARLGYAPGHRPRGFLGRLFS